MIVLGGISVVLIVGRERVPEDGIGEDSHSLRRGVRESAMVTITVKFSMQWLDFSGTLKERCTEDPMASALRSATGPGTASGVSSSRAHLKCVSSCSCPANTGMIQNCGSKHVKV